MRPPVKKLLGRLQLGCYIVSVSDNGGANAVPLTRPERAAYGQITKELAGTGRHPQDWEPGSYLVRTDGHGNAYEVQGMNAAESKAFIVDVLGRFRS